MRFIVYGAGAVGGVVGARLHEHGHDTVLIARGDHAAAIARRGLRLETPDGATTHRIPVCTSPAEIDPEPGDVVLVAVKSQDTAEVVESLAAAVPPETPVVCLQNGVANERAALRYFANVHAVTVMCPTTHLEPGIVQSASSPITGLLDVGRYPAGSDGVDRELARAFQRSTFESVVRPDVMRWKYGKLLMNLRNAVDALCGRPAVTGEVAERVVAEGRACLSAAGIDYVGEEEDRERRGERITLRPVGERRHSSSSWQSLARGVGTIETDYLNGEIVLIGRLTGVPTPANELMQRRARAMARSGAPPGSVTEAELLAELEEQTPAR